MIAIRQGLVAAAALCTVVCTGLLPGLAAAASSGQLYYERALMSAADARCRLFQPDVSAALTAATFQARGAVLRAGADRATVASVEARARSAADRTPCNSRDLAIGAARVKSAFEGYERLNTMSFPGDVAGWSAVRLGNAKTSNAWRLSQTANTPAGRMVFGIASDATGDRLTAVAAWPGALQASGARLIVRDPTRSPEPYLDPRRRDLEGRAPPRSVSLVVLASGRAPAAANLLSGAAGPGATFRFPASALRALEALDPREALAIELVYPTRTGERVERAVFEVGDFMAGYAFLEAGR